MIASVNLDVSIVNVTNESAAGRRRKGRDRHIHRINGEVTATARRDREEGIGERKRFIFG